MLDSIAPDDFSDFEIVGENRGVVLCLHTEFRLSNEIARRICFEDFVRVIDSFFFFYMDFVDKVENYSSNEARNCSNLLSSYVYTREENSLDIRRWWILEINETLTRFGKIVF